jgi:hypothetical protein
MYGSSAIFFAANASAFEVAKSTSQKSSEIINLKN